jgi:hypothetical protein
LSISSKVEHKKFSCFGSSNPQNFLFADSRAIASVQRHTLSRHGTARHFCQDMRLGLRGKLDCSPGKKPAAQTSTS